MAKYCIFEDTSMSTDEIFASSREGKKALESQMKLFIEDNGLEWRIRHVRFPNKKERESGLEYETRNTSLERKMVKIRGSIFCSDMPVMVTFVSKEKLMCFEANKITVEPPLHNEGTIASIGRRIKVGTRWEWEEEFYGVSKCYEKTFDRLTGRVIAMARAMDNFNKREMESVEMESVMCPICEMEECFGVTKAGMIYCHWCGNKLGRIEKECLK